MSDFKEYKPVEPEYNVQAAVENMKEAYWSNEPGKFAKIFTDAEAIIISAICHHGYTLCKETTEGDCISREALKEEVYTWGYDYDKEDFIKAIDNAPPVELNDAFFSGYAKGLDDAKSDIITLIANEYTSHGEMVPNWLLIGETKVVDRQKKGSEE